MLVEINRLAERTAKREKVVVRRRDIIHAKSKSFNDIIVQCWLDSFCRIICCDKLMFDLGPNLSGSHHCNFASG